MTNIDKHALVQFKKLAARLAQHMKRNRVTESSATSAEHLMYAMREILDGASPGVRKAIKQTNGWKS
jgi:hypothetical protein